LRSLAERETGEILVRDTTSNGGSRETFSAIKVPRQCPLVLLVKQIEEKVQAFRSGEHKIKETLSRAILHSVGILNSDNDLGRAAFGEMVGEGGT
jgi:hypothetical protein